MEEHFSESEIKGKHAWKLFDQKCSMNMLVKTHEPPKEQNASNGVILQNSKFWEQTLILKL